MEIKHIGLIGMGQMGKGIAQVCAISGFKVFVHDSDHQVLKSSKKHIENNLLKLEKKK